jgi:hypothetical protein
MSATASEQEVFENPSEAVRRIARKAADLAEGTVKKQIIGKDRTTILVESPEGISLIFTNGAVDDATSEIAKAFENQIERMLITIDRGRSNSVDARLQSGETMKVRVIAVSTRMSRKPLSLPPSPSIVPTVSQPVAASPSPTVAPAPVCLDISLPKTKEDTTALLRNAVMPTPASVLNGGADAKAAFGRKRRFLMSIANGITFFSGHNDGADPPAFILIRTRVGTQDFSFNLYRLGTIDNASPGLRDMPQAFVFVGGDSHYILLPTLRADTETKRLILESAIAR